MSVFNCRLQFLWHKASYRAYAGRNKVAQSFVSKLFSSNAATETVKLPHQDFYNYLKLVQSRLLNNRATKWPPSILEFLGNSPKISLQNLNSLVNDIKIIDKINENFGDIDELMTEEIKGIDLSERNELIAVAEDEKGGLLEEIRLCDEKITDELCELIQNGVIVNSVVLEVSAGVGGQEAMLFASELFEMYQSFCASNGQDFEILEVSETDIGGFQKATAIVHFNHKNMYHLLKNESGTHRVQRVPVTEKSGRIHTSTASVALLPVFDDSLVTLEEKDIEIQRVKKSNSSGGQHANKVESGVRIKHLPTGKIVECNATRSQHENKDKALKLLAAKLSTEKKAVQESMLTKSRKQQVKNRERSDKIRTYNYSQDRITDHRLGVSIRGVNNFLRGDSSLLDVMEKLNDKFLLEELQETLKMLVNEGRTFFKNDIKF